MSTLIDAAARGDVEAVTALLAGGASPDVTEDNDRTALMEASALGHREVVEALLARGADPSLRDGDGWTALMEACDFGHAAIAAALLDRGADPFVQEPRGFFAMKLAERGGHRDVVRLFHEREIDHDWRAAAREAASCGDVAVLERARAKGRDLTLADEHGRSIVHLGAQAGHLDVVAFAIAAGIPMDQTSNGETALAMAASEGHAAIVTLLADAGADLTAPDGDGATPLQIAMNHGQTEVVRALFDRGAVRPGELEQVFSYAIDNDEALARTLAERGQPLDISREEHRPLAMELIAQGKKITLARATEVLSGAVDRGEIDLVRALLDNGADPNECVYGDEPALARAKASRKKDAKAIAALLVARGATMRGAIRARVDRDKELSRKQIAALLAQGDDLNAADDKGRTALQIAAERGKTDVMELLIEAGAALDPKGEGGRTPLLAAASGGFVKAVELLLRAGADVRATDDEGWSAATSLLAHGKNKLAQRIVKRGASPRSMLSGAAASGDPEAVKLAVELGADPSFVTASGESIARKAAETGKRRVLDAVLAAGAQRDGALHGAALSGDAKLVRYCLDVLKIPVDAQDGGQTALHLAATESAEAVAILLEHGASVDARESDGFTPLMWAVEYDKTKAAELLLAHGADKELRDKNGRRAEDFLHIDAPMKLRKLFGKEDESPWYGRGMDDDDDDEE